MRVRVYWNLHKKKFSIQHKGKVIGHADAVALGNVVFHVNENGRQRVLRERKKYVHAYVVGDIHTFAYHLHDIRNNDALIKFYLGVVPLSKQIKYNPYKSAHFNDGEDSYTAADAVYMVKSRATHTPITYAQGAR